ncbi:hypothetical protein COY95_00360, partial [Candidatus Woesearchaeota archaeon CG_4_10_14_0_8_um_filter_47_5]
MKVLMFGWEFPPQNSGGLGTACYGLTKALANQGVDVLFVMPTCPGSIDSSHLSKLIVADTIHAGRVKIKGVDFL